MAETTFRKDRHIKYFLRCLKSFLPHQYTSSDSNRVLLAFFTVAGLDLLGVLPTNTTPEERQGYIDWLYHCQVPSGGFRGFTGTNFGLDRRTPENEVWDPANVPATFFALATLLILGDDLSRVKRKECLRWLPRVQREDGSFGELLSVDGQIAGGRDLRYCCCAAGIRYILRGRSGEGLEDVEDINVDKLVSFIEACQTYDGGISQASFCEAHAGLSYCAIGALSFLGRVPNSLKEVKLMSPGTEEFESLVKWLVSRQTTELEEEEEEEEGEEEDAGKADETQEISKGLEGLSLDDKIAALPYTPTPTEDLLRWAGFNGRCNKLADTCYCFWVTGTLAMMDRLHLIEPASDRRYLIEKTQHLVGGFGKGVGESPDLLHSYLGLVNLALLGEPGLEPVDPTLCTSRRTIQHLESLPWWRE
ncbi:putative geranylgeranyl transferase beta subunit [Thermoascus aurantiacus ATCC 26904]